VKELILFIQQGHWIDQKWQ